MTNSVRLIREAVATWRGNSKASTVSWRGELDRSQARWHSSIMSFYYYHYRSSCESSYSICVLYFPLYCRRRNVLLNRSSGSRKYYCSLLVLPPCGAYVSDRMLRNQSRTLVNIGCVERESKYFWVHSVIIPACRVIWTITDGFHIQISRPLTSRCFFFFPLWSLLLKKPRFSHKRVENLCIYANCTAIIWIKMLIKVPRVVGILHTMNNVS